jgi:glycosyltransferase involved in cell wall biosynthesis
MKVALFIDKFNDWYGGADFILLLLHGLQRSNVEYEIFVRNNREGIIEAIKNWLFSRPSRYEITQYILDNLHRDDEPFFFNTNAELQSLVFQHNVEILFPVFDSDISTTASKVGYIYDFQHKYLPDFFSEEDISSRDSQFKKTLDVSDYVIVNANTVKKDIISFYGEGFSENVKVLPFATKDLPPKTKVFLERSRYFVICNQFWRHKDHLTALRGFREFVTRDEFKDYSLYLTGVAKDYRGSDHIEEIHMLISEINSSSQRVYLTGFLDVGELNHLIANAAALIQPTLFEGGRGGGAGPLALSLGTPCILSDINVNLELKGQYGTKFFKAGDSNDLSDQLICVDAHNYDYIRIANEVRLSSDMLSEFLDTILR